MSNLENILGEAFNPDEYEDFSSGPKPAGEYTVEVVETEVRKTESGRGVGVNVKFEILGPTYAGSYFYEWFNLMHESEKAQRIGRAQFGSLCRAAGTGPIKDTDKLLGQKLILEVRIDAKDPNKNRIWKYLPIGGQGAPAQPAKNPASRAKAKPDPEPGQPDPAQGVMPWQQESGNDDDDVPF